MTRTSVWAGAGLGALMSLPVMVLALAAQAIAGLPFLPFDLFEWTTRWLPGKVVTFGIDTMVAVITALGVHPTSVAAKIAEKTLAVGAFAGSAAVLGALVALAARRAGVRWIRLGLVAGAAWSALAVVAEVSIGLRGPSRAASLAWVLALLLSWGAALGATLRMAEPAADVPIEERAARRRVLRWLVGSLVAFSALALGLVSSLRRGRPRGPAAPRTEVLGATGTAGPAASPPPEVLAGRIEPVPGTRREITRNEDFYRIDINLQPPRVDAAAWRLEVDGLVDRPLRLAMEEIRALPAISQMVTLECISNRLGGDLIGTSRWTGVRLMDVLGLARMRQGARAVLVHAADGFYESVGMADAADERTLLVYEMNGVPLPAEHGFPLRIYIPNRHGMKQPKWITRLRVGDEEGSGFWVDRGWSKDAVPHTTSVVDTVGMSMMIGEAKVVPVGGIAYAGARGISKVEVQVDGGPWVEAKLVAPPLSPLTWAQWRHEWRYQPGRHTFRVRAYDGAGRLQPTEERGPRPDGVSGIHSLDARV